MLMLSYSYIQDNLKKWTEESWSVEMYKIHSYLYMRIMQYITFQLHYCHFDGLSRYWFLLECCLYSHHLFSQFLILIEKREPKTTSLFPSCKRAGHIFSTVILSQVPSGVGFDGWVETPFTMSVSPGGKPLRLRGLHCQDHARALGQSSSSWSKALHRLMHSVASQKIKIKPACIFLLEQQPK